ncbi:MAG: hypothetical protein CBB71_00980 [Rhodopirellula sp. TMED11]|nr:MAG: hypothetical protein CBB71_00980 [Rhodopirellula sp. TMED11]
MGRVELIWAILLMVCNTPADDACISGVVCIESKALLSVTSDLGYRATSQTQDQVLQGQVYRFSLGATFEHNPAAAVYGIWPSATLLLAAGGNNHATPKCIGHAKPMLMTKCAPYGSMHGVFSSRAFKNVVGTFTDLAELRWPGLNAVGRRILARSDIGIRRPGESSAADSVSLIEYESQAASTVSKKRHKDHLNLWWIVQLRILKPSSVRYGGALTRLRCFAGARVVRKELRPEGTLPLRTHTDFHRVWPSERLQGVVDWPASKPCRGSRRLAN